MVENRIYMYKKKYVHVKKYLFMNYLLSNH